MKADLVEKIKEFYPYGIFELMDETKVDKQAAKCFWAAIQSVAESMGFNVKYEYWSGSLNVFLFPFKRIGDGNGWYFNENKKEKIEAMKILGMPHVNVRVHVSTVVPAFYVNITETWFDPDTYGGERYDAGLKYIHHMGETLFYPWSGLVNEIRRVAQDCGLEEFSNEELREDVAFVTSPQFTDDDDGSDDIDFDVSDPRYLPYLRSLEQYVCTLYDVLFADVV